MGDDIVTEENNPYTEIEGDITGMPIVVVDDFKAAVKEPVVKVLMNKEAERLVEVEKKLQQQLEGQLSVMRSKPFFLEFTEAGVTKGTSLNKLIQKLGIKREEVIAMGDSYNDQAMIEFAGLGVAMGNAPDDIKEIANYVTDTNMNDGVAKVVEKFVLKRMYLFNIFIHKTYLKSNTSNRFYLNSHAFVTIFRTLHYSRSVNFLLYIMKQNRLFYFEKEYKFTIYKHTLKEATLCYLHQSDD